MSPFRRHMDMCERGAPDDPCSCFEPRVNANPSAAILRDRHGRDVPIHVHDAHTTQNGLPVISIDGELWTVEPVQEASHD